jgi:ferredoxin-NADP reductase
MARAAIQRRLIWRTAEVLDNRAETPRVHRLVLDVPDWPGHLPGQHVVVRLTAEDGYTAQRSYSLASPPDVAQLHLTVERLDGGEVSPYLTDEVQRGDRLELRGPIGGYFVWSAAADRADGEQRPRPVQLVAGGSGVAPFLAMVEHHGSRHSSTPLRLLYSTRTAADVLGRDVLGAETTITLTRESPPDWPGPTGRVDRDLLARCTFPPAERPRVFVCGSTPFVESVAATLIDLGHDPSAIRLERYGNSEEPK